MADKKRPSKARQRFNDFRLNFQNRRAQSAKGLTRSSRVTASAKRDLAKGKEGLRYLRDKTREFQRKHPGQSPGQALGSDLRQSVPKLNPLGRKKGLRNQ